MRTAAAELGDRGADQPIGADFTVQGEVRMVTDRRRQQRVEIQWIINDATGHDLGRVVQLNDIPAGSLDHYWGDVAMVVAQEASGGVNDVIQRQSGREPAAGQQAAGQQRRNRNQRLLRRPNDRAMEPAGSGRRMIVAAQRPQTLGPARMKIVACNSNRPLAEAVAATLNLPLTTRLHPPLRRHGGVRRNPRERARRGRVRRAVHVVSGERQPDGAADHAGRAAPQSRRGGSPQ